MLRNVLTRVFAFTACWCGILYVGLLGSIPICALDARKDLRYRVLCLLIGVRIYSFFCPRHDVAVTEEIDVEACQSLRIFDQSVHSYFLLFHSPKTLVHAHLRLLQVWYGHPY